MIKLRRDDLLHLLLAVGERISACLMDYHPCPCHFSLGSDLEPRRGCIACVHQFPTLPNTDKKWYLFMVRQSTVSGPPFPSQSGAP